MSFKKYDYLDFVEGVTGIAAMFHDWGKSSEIFQSNLMDTKSRGEPLRHEWISALFLNAYISGKSDESWLENLLNGDFDRDRLIANVSKNIEEPFERMSEVGCLITWLVITHHKMPIEQKCKFKKDDKWVGVASADFSKTLKWIKKEWGFKNSLKGRYESLLSKCFVFGKLPCDSDQWINQIKYYVKKLIGVIGNYNSIISSQLIKPIALYSRLSLILGDHYYSSQPITPRKIKYSKSVLYANTDNTGKPKQELVEHLCGVAKCAVNVVNNMHRFAGDNPKWFAKDFKALNRQCNEKWKWQQNAGESVNNWILKNKHLDKGNYGFFGVNMASTGKGKTIANARIMKELSYDSNSLRFILAVGLRVLTLQTATEYQKVIGLSKEHFAVLVGTNNTRDVGGKYYGSESSESISIGHVVYDAGYDVSELKVVLDKKKDRDLLNAPVISCTIDHIMAAIQTKSGCKFILPTLRLMSSDLVIDEIDNFDGEDLVAIGGLIHLAGMLGRKVLISSATITPDISEAYYKCYMKGWVIYAELHKKPFDVGCGWFDEFKSVVATCNEPTEYHGMHKHYVVDRATYLENMPIKTLAKVVECNVGTRYEYYSSIFQHINTLHQHHGFKDNVSNKSISFGVVRMANINPCIELTKYLLNVNCANDTEIFVMAYHAQQPMILRSEQESYLDDVLCRKDNKSPLSNSVVRKHLSRTIKKNIIFIVVATPVADIGRDHDYDWAVLEPSSYYSIIQLGGRVMRHRESFVVESNIVIMQYNLKSIEGVGVAFRSPGFESKFNKLKSHDMSIIFSPIEKLTNINSIARILKPDTLNPSMTLRGLEHHVIYENLNNDVNNGPESLMGNVGGYWWLTGMNQYHVKFRRGSPVVKWHLVVDGSGFDFVHLKAGNKISLRNGISFEQLNESELSRLWIKRDYGTLLKDKCGALEPDDVCMVFGEVGISQYENINNVQYTYIDQIGIHKNTSV